MYESLDAQLDGEPCLICLETEISCPPTGREWDEETHLTICGSPCDPFSMQRAKRFSTGSVKSHSDFATTMEGVTKAYLTYEPHVGIMEQVSGFLLPFEAGGTETPFSRPDCHFDFPGQTCNLVTVTFRTGSFLFWGSKLLPSGATTM